MFTVKGARREVVVKLYAGRHLRAHAKVTVDDLVTRTAKGMAKVPLECKQGGKVEKAFVEMVQIYPRATPPPPPVYPVGYNRKPDPTPRAMFPPSSPPTSAQVWRILEKMYGPAPSPRDWELPFTTTTTSSPQEEAAPPPDRHEGQDENLRGAEGLVFSHLIH